jgi:site-specific recombinase XerD
LDTAVYKAPSYTLILLAMNFNQFLQQKNHTPKTITRHGLELKKYAAWLKTIDKCELQATTKDLLNYLQHLQDTRHLCNATQQKVLERLKNYYAYLAQTEGIKNITAFIKIRGVKKVQLHTILNNADIEQLCEAYYYHTQQTIPSNKELRYYTNQSQLLQGYYITLTLIAYQALSVNEVLQLKKEHFNLHKGTVNVQAHLRGNARTLKLEATQIGTIIAFYSQDPNALLMLNLNHFEKLNQTLKTLLPNKYKDFRQLRASKITEWIKTQGLRKAQVLAGHRSIIATEKYIPNNIEELHNDFNLYHPLQ